MLPRRTAARPYARAVFDLAAEHGMLKHWSEMLATAAALARDDTVRALVNDPRIGYRRAAEIFILLCGEKLDEQGANFLRLLTENRRLALLPEIAVFYEELRAAAEGRREATVVSAFPLSAEQMRKIQQALVQHLERKIDLSLQVDKSLVGGIVIRAGDIVIDGSVRGRLQQLASALNQ